jgi:hypothetical protein
MIQQRAEELGALIAHQRTLNEQVRQLEGFRGQLQEIDRAAVRIAPRVKTWRLFRERSIGNWSPEPQAGVLLQQIIELRARYDSDRASILGPNRLAILRSIHALADTLEQRLLATWKAHAQVLVPAVNNDVLNVLSRIAALRSSVDAVWTGLRELDALLLRLPGSAAEIDAFEAKAADVRMKWDAFDSRHLPQEVLRFLKDAGGTGAPLDTLTETVQQWLRENHLTASFRIRSASTINTGL